MSSLLLGLDIGSYSIKGALFSATFKAFELTDLFESPPLQLDNLDDNDKTVVIREAILRLLSEHRDSISGTAISIPGSLISTRILSLPLPERQISKVLPFEIESHIPFEVEEVIVDHHLIQGDKNQSLVLAGALKKTTLAEHLALLKSVNLDPSFVTLDSLSLFNLNQLPLAGELGTYAIVDIGHQKTSICIVSNQQVRYVRTLFTAGRAITENISKELDLTWEQAQEVKHTHSILELSSRALQSDDLRKLSKAIQGVVDPLLRDILQTFQAYRAQYSQTPHLGPGVEKVFLCGGSALVRNLPEYLHQLTQLDVKRLSIFPTGNQATEKLGDREPIFAHAVSLGLRSASRGVNSGNIARMNFRKNEFAFARDLSGIWEKASFVGRWVGAVFLLALLHQGLRYQSLSRQYSKMEKEILKSFNELSPNENPKPKSASVAMKTLESRIAQYRQKEEILTAGLKQLTALDILKEISARIPENIPMDTQELSIDRNKVVLRANTDSLTSVDEIISALKDYPEFSAIDRGDIRESADGKKSFVLTVTIGDDNPKPVRKSKGKA